MFSLNVRREWMMLVFLTCVAAYIAFGFAKGYGDRVATENNKLTHQLTQAFYVFGSVNNGPAGTVVYDDDFMLVYASDGIERLTGWSAAEIMGRDDRLILIPATVKEELREMSLFEPDQLVRFGRDSGIYLEAQNGEQIPVEVTAHQYPWASGETWWSMTIIPMSDIQDVQTYQAGRDQLEGDVELITLLVDQSR